MNKEYSNLQKELSEGRAVITFTTGVSMEPLLHDKNKSNATHVLVVPKKGKLSVGDIPLFLWADGKYMMHRIVDVRQKDGQTYYYTRGDNCIGGEVVAEEAILGVVKEIYKGKKTIDVKDRGYLLYVRVWMALYPIRKAWAFVRSLLLKIKRKLL